MGVVAFILLALGMVLAPRIRPREPKHTPPPGDPEPLRSSLATPRRPDPPCWPPNHPALAMIALLLTFVSFAGCTAGGLWATRAFG
jgi:hypothetical protein